QNAHLAVLQETLKLYGTSRPVNVRPTAMPAKPRRNLQTAERPPGHPPATVILSPLLGSLTPPPPGGPPAAGAADRVQPGAATTVNRVPGSGKPARGRQL